MPTLRRATPADLDTAAALFDAYRQFYGQPPDLDRARGFLAERLGTGDTALILAFDSAGAGLGFTHLFPSFTSVGTARIVVLNDLFVAPEARGQGVGAALLAAAEAHACDVGAVRLVLQTATDNAAAQRLYQRAGWTPDEAFMTFEKPVG
ncbi:MAG TPA: GNAT family N-acetyltransferase [Rubricoccaceae bacterium]|jgi:GNAT superfamily N-acetyltransferase